MRPSDWRETGSPLVAPALRVQVTCPALHGIMARSPGRYHPDWAAYCVNSEFNVQRTDRQNRIGSPAWICRPGCDRNRQEPCESSTAYARRPSSRSSASSKTSWAALDSTSGASQKAQQNDPWWSSQIIAAGSPDRQSRKRGCLRHSLLPHSPVACLSIVPSPDGRVSVAGIQHILRRSALHVATDCNIITYHI